jgi:hypothetical protein
MRNDFGIRPRPKLKAGGRVKAKHGGRAKKQLGGVGAVGGVGAPVGTARRDMRSGYYPNDMGMQGGAMYKKGGRVKAKHGGSSGKWSTPKKNWKKA